MYWRVRTPPSVLLAAATLGGLLAGCGPPPELTETPPPQPRPTTGTTTGPPGAGGLPVAPPGALPTPSPGFSEDRAVPCEGEPGGDAVLAVLQDQDMISADADAEVAEGPLCAGTWQYAVVSVPDRDPLQVVTRGEPDALELVAAGTEVCTVDVRVLAPSGIRVTADCVG